MTAYKVTSEKWLKKTINLMDDYFEHLTTILHQEKSFDETEIVAPVSKTLYCGCQDCVRRESLAFCIPVIIEAYKDGIIQEVRR